MLLVLAGFAASLPAADPPGFDGNRHMRVDDVKPGMKGYGLSVFQGVQIEPFEVEVVSVQSGFDPGRSVVWVRCPDERMQKSGPVRGMSGSPIYLWSEKEVKSGQAKPGQGGRLLGAFAFGHRFGRDCYVGIQPIEYMLETSSRAVARPARASADGAGGHHALHLANTFQMAREMGLDEKQSWRLRAIAKLLQYEDQAPPIAPQSASPSPFSTTPLPLPITVGSAAQSEAIGPLLRPLGFSVHALPAASSRPPSWIDPDKVQLKPGSVFVVPLAFGPLEMAATGTTTEVLPDGSVLAFGHSFFGLGDVSAPMATGYVHFVQPTMEASFKLGGSLKVMGAMVRDEAVGIVGKPGGKYATVPVKLTVNWPQQTLSRTFEYQVVHLNRLLPSLLGSVVTGSLTSWTDLPRLNTLKIEGAIRFANGWELPIKLLQAGTPMNQLTLAMISPIGPLIENPYKPADLKSVDLTIQVEEGLRAGTILGVTLRQSSLRPGDKLQAHVRIHRHRGGEETRKVELTIPRGLPDGQYMLSVGGLDNYFQQQMATKPHLRYATNEQELFESIRYIYSLPDDALYVSLLMQTPNNVSLGRTSLPRLPSSRVALLVSEGSSIAQPYAESLDVVTPVPYAVMGEAALPVQVRREPEKSR